MCSQKIIALDIQERKIKIWMSRIFEFTYLLSYVDVCGRVTKKQTKGSFVLLEKRTQSLVQSFGEKAEDERRI